MALNGEIRQVFADLNDIQEWLEPDLDLEMDDQRFYGVTSIFGQADESQGYFCWSRQMKFEAPGELAVNLCGRPDYKDAARLALEPYVDGLGNCQLRLYHGRLLAKYQFHKNRTTFELLPPTESPDVLILARWPDGRMPIYDMRPDGVFVRELGAKLILRVHPGQNSIAEDNTGYDLWIVSQGKLGSRFANRTEAWESFRCYVQQDNWRDFELYKTYYRQKMQAICDDIQDTITLACKLKLSSGNPIKIELHDDYVKTFLSKTYAVDGDAVVRRHWYNKAGYNNLEGLRLTLAPIRATLITLQEMGVF